MAELRYSDQFEVRPGWSYLQLAPLGGGAWAFEHLEALRHFVAQVIGDHPCQLFHDWDWLGVGIGPPDAKEVADRLADVFTELGALDDDLNQGPYRHRN